MKADRHIAPILFSGPSGIGKTTFISKLIDCYPAFYARPLSLTTRPRRLSEGDAEYKFVTDEEFAHYESEGRLANSDTAYGNKYGITKSSLSSLCTQLICPVKEVRPENHHKIRSFFPGTISVLFISNRCPTYENDPLRQKRAKEDKDYYSVLSHDSFDVIFPIPTTDHLERAVAHLHGTIQSILANNKYPRPGEIEQLNRDNYASILPEFYDSCRPTTANFHQLTLRFWTRIAHKMTNSPRVLEVGVGNGWLMKSFPWHNLDYTGIDVVPSTDPLIHTASSREIGFESESFDCVISSLADPFLFPASIREIHRVIKPHGLLIFTVPAKEWAIRLRDIESSDRTAFTLESGRRVEVFSFCVDKIWFEDVLPTYGFKLVDLETMSVGDLPAGTDISDAIANPSLDKIDLPIIHAAIAERI